MLLNLSHIYKDYQQEKLVVPVLKDVSVSWKRENMWQSWDLPVPEKRH